MGSKRNKNGRVETRERKECETKVEREFSQIPKDPFRMANEVSKLQYQSFKF